MKDTSRNQSAELKHAGLKATGPRMKILEIFQEASLQGKRHMSADDVYKALLAEDMDVGLATVYRVLTQFETAGILIRHHFDTDYATFELDDGYHHDHLVCLKCGAVEEFVDREIEERQNEIAKRFGFKLESHSLSLYGTTNCRKTPRSDSEASKKRAGEKRFSPALWYSDEYAGLYSGFPIPSSRFLFLSASFFWQAEQIP